RVRQHPAPRGVVLKRAREHHARLAELGRRQAYRGHESDTNRMSERSRALALLAVSLILSMTTWFSASAVVPQLRTEWSLSSTGAAWLTIAVQLGFVAGALTSSVFNVADMFSPRSVILAGSIGAAAANVLLAAAHGAGLGIPLRVATGFCLAGVYPPALKLMATWFR